MANSLAPATWHENVQAGQAPAARENHHARKAGAGGWEDWPFYPEVVRVRDIKILAVILVLGDGVAAPYQ